MTNNQNGTGEPRPASPWADGAHRAVSPRQVMASITGGFGADDARRALADDGILAFVNRYLTEYRRRTGHLPYMFQSRVDDEIADPTEEGDWDLRVAFAVGYGIPDNVFDELRDDAATWGTGMSMGAVPYASTERRTPVLLGDADKPATPSPGTAAWDVSFLSQQCHVLVRADRERHTLAIRCEWPDHDGRHTITLRFPDGLELELDATIVRGVWRAGNIDNPDDLLPVSCRVSL
ncbi:hypothetical protein JS532_01640 [Bifidobacterium callimiconis]|uniref:hypothetical protein n=1 Tax=Bifidobacterium callimiconis TaxID=2306973 RepID=UPI001BDBBDBF|nr:hypothetical protein [Bifidobacterium callimiconis]MBT1176267.1 hypothetical protein [Bifidobacterium callimiconis]